MDQHRHNALVGVGIVDLFPCTDSMLFPGAGQIILYLATMLLGVTIHYSILFSLLERQSFLDHPVAGGSFGATITL